MAYDTDRLRNDPTYAPGISWSKNTARWKCPKKYLTAGYSVKAVQLEPGHPEDLHQPQRARRCRELTLEMLDWYNDGSRMPTEGTWAWVIYRYKADDFSPFQDVKANTKAGYVDLLKRWEVAIGHLRTGQMTYPTIMGIKQKMIENGRTDSNIHRMFTMLRTVSKYGSMLGDAGARETKAILSDMKFRKAPARDIAPTRAQIRAIVDEADARGMFAFATGIMIQYEYALRAVDVRGQWLSDPSGEGGIRRGDKLWQDGLTWDMIKPDLSSFEKVISKTARSLPAPYTFDLTLVPEIQGRLRLLRNAKGTGPVIVSENHNQPYQVQAWSRAWARIRKDLKLPSELKMMDTRAGAGTEAHLAGADPMQLRNAMQHKNVSTTDRYIRGRNQDAENVVRLRQGK